MSSTMSTNNSADDTMPASKSSLSQPRRPMAAPALIHSTDNTGRYILNRNTLTAEDIRSRFIKSIKDLESSFNESTTSSKYISRPTM